MSLLRSTATIGSYTLISRILGFLRDVTIASSLGASMLSDAFFVAFKIPNFFRRLFAEGAFNAAFVPIFAGMLATEGKEKAEQFAAEAMAFLFAILVLVSGFFIVLMPYLMLVLAPGFSDDPAKFDLTVTLTRITFPYIIFISLVSLFGGILNSSERFAAVAATPILMNLCLIIVPTLVGSFTPTGAHALSIAVMVAGVVQFIWLAYFCWRVRMLPRLVWPHLTQGVKRLLTLVAPAALGAGVVQVNLFVDLIIASHIPIGVSYLYYADRINELPLAVIGIAVGTALLPMLSKQIREGRLEEAQKSQVRAIELALFFSLPASVALMVIAEPIIHVMFERGNFTPTDTLATWRALAAFAAGLPAFVLVKVLAPGFYANQDTKTPMKIAVVCVACNFVLNLALIIPLQHVGMALATTIAGWLNVVLMARALKQRNLLTLPATLLKQVARILAACMVMVMAMVLLASHFALATYLAQGEIIRALALGAMVLSGMVAFGVSAMLLGTLDTQMVASVFKRKR